MPTIIKKLGEEDQEDWERLRDTYRGGFLHGKCYPFAIALHEGLDWPMVGLFVKKCGMECIYHAGVQNPEGRIFDIRGFVTKEEFGKLYTNPPYDVRNITIKDLNGGAPHGDYAIRRAREIAEILWPELPWKKTHISNITAFADELETLCRKHKLWIRAPFPAQTPVIAKGVDDEGGYVLRPTVDGSTYTIDRYLIP